MFVNVCWGFGGVSVCCVWDGFCGIGRMIFCSVWVCMVWVCGSECLLCVGRFVVRFGV